MKLPWSKQKSPYTRHSAPIINGILRNGKGSKSTNRPRHPRRDDGMRVSFSLRRTGSSQMCHDMIRAESEKPSASRSKKPSRRPKEEHPRRRRKNADSEKAERNEGSRDQQRGRKNKSVTRTPKERKRSDLTSARVKGGSSDTDERRLSRSIASAVSEGSSDTLGSLEKSERRLGDLPAENIASGYGKWESNGTIDTADISDHSAERPRLRTNLSKERPRPRTKLSLLLDEKIEAKMRRQLREERK